MRDAVLARLLQAHIREHDRHGGRPLWEAIVAQCREMGIAGATVFRGVEGYGDAAEIHRPRLVGADLPVIVAVVDAPEKIAALASVVESMMDRGVLVMEDVAARRVRKP